MNPVIDKLCVTVPGRGMANSVPGRGRRRRVASGFGSLFGAAFIFQLLSVRLGTDFVVKAYGEG
jgi:hypothetical protein